MYTRYISFGKQSLAPQPGFDPQNRSVNYKCQCPLTLIFLAHERSHPKHRTLTEYVEALAMVHVEHGLAMHHAMRDGRIDAPEFAFVLGGVAQFRCFRH